MQGAIGIECQCVVRRLLAFAGSIEVDVTGPVRWRSGASSLDQHIVYSRFEQAAKMTQ